MPRDWSFPTPKLTRLDGLVALGLALLVIAYLLVSHSGAIGTLAFRDGDDALRLVQVRDWLAGQGWFDVSQHRINPPTGGLMHWSRLIDAQIGGLILLLRPLLGVEQAEIWALALYPPLLLLPLFVLIALVVRRLSDDQHVVLAGLLLGATTLTFLHYFVPLRIDHHNWQTILSLAMLALALGAPSWQSGVLAGLVMSLHLSVSLEALPYGLIFGGLFAWHWLRDTATGRRLYAFVASLVLVAPLILLATRGIAGITTPWCDAWSAPYLLAIGGAALGLFGAVAVLPVQRSFLARLAALGIAAGVGLLLFVWQARECLAGPFGELEPLVRSYWYDNVLEGRPVTRQPLVQIALLVAPSLVGLALTLWQWHRAPTGIAKARWGDMALVLAASVLLSLLVARTTAVTHLYALPGLAASGVQLWRHARSLTGVAGRVLLSVAVLLVAPPVIGRIALTAAAPFIKPDKAGDAAPGCPRPADFAGLARMPKTVVLAAIDIGPMVLAHTPHAVIATGHHRNHAAMNRVITSFAATPDQSEAIVRASGATLMLICPRAPEIGNIARQRPDSLAAVLANGDAPAWLEPLAMPGGSAARLYRVRSAVREPRR